MGNFKEMVLLYEELIRKESEHYIALNTKEVYAQPNAESYGKSKANSTMKMIYGQHDADCFIEEYNRIKSLIV